MKNLYSILFLSLLLTFGCKDPKPVTTTAPKPAVKIPAFNQDLAYGYIEKQLSFGPRNPGSPGHVACKDWFVEKFESQGATVIAQEFTANIYTGDSYPAWNIIAQFNPDHKRRVILSAHWDTRFIGEEDSNKSMRDKPIPGADDGGSGCGILVEIGRILQENPIDLGVDIILWDAEDQGKRGDENYTTTWCLGSQYWSKNKHAKGYNARFGINLDMVGGKNPSFGKDLVSKRYAQQIQDKVWQLAQNMGYSDMFHNKETGLLTDDHLMVNQIAKIPMIDIINQPDTPKKFINEWHTHDDDIAAIDKRTLRVVGQVITAVIYKESDGSF